MEISRVPRQREVSQAVEKGAGGAALAGSRPSAGDSPLWDPDWEERALCAQADPEAFFPEKGGSTKEAKRVCARCEVKEECLEYALGHENFGVWGGLTERERRKLLRRR